MDGSADNADCGNKENADGNADGESKHADNAAENNEVASGETKESRDGVKFTVTAEPENTSNQSDNADGEERK